MRDTGTARSRSCDRWAVDHPLPLGRRRLGRSAGQPQRWGSRSAMTLAAGTGRYPSHPPLGGTKL